MFGNFVNNYSVVYEKIYRENKVYFEEQFQERMLHVTYMSNSFTVWLLKCLMYMYEYLLCLRHLCFVLHNDMDNIL